MERATTAQQLRERVGRRIAALRARRGWSQELLGEHANLSQVYLSKVENARVACSVDTLAALASALDVGPAELLTETTD